VGVHDFSFEGLVSLRDYIWSTAGGSGFKSVDVNVAGLVFGSAVAFNFDVYHLPRLRVLLFIQISLRLVSYSPLPSDTARHSKSYPRSLRPLLHSESGLTQGVRTNITVGNI